MSNAGQAVLSIGGAVVGWFVGGPAGAAWGFQLGGLAGSALFPTDLGTVSGPRLNDLNVQSSAVGAPIPIVYGTYAISGNVIWSSGLIEAVSRKKQGGKGGPTQTTKTYTYSVNCAVGVCEGEIGGIRRIWADAKLIYDARAQLDGETSDQYTARQEANAALLANTEIYLGDELQLPDPTIESFEGAGNVSAFRDLAYVVFTEFQLADYGNRVPNFRFEVSTSGLNCTDTREYSNEVLYPWLSGAIADPRNPSNDHLYRHYNTGTPGTYESAAQDLEDAINAYPSNLTPISMPRSFPYWTNLSSTVLLSDIAPYTAVVPGEQLELYLAHFWTEFDAVANVSGGTVPCDINVGEMTLFLADVVATYAVAPYYKVGSGGCSAAPAFTYFTASASYNCASPAGSTACEFAWGGLIAVKRVPTAPPADEDGPWLLDNAGSYKALAIYEDDTSTTVLQYPLNPVRPVGHADDTEAFWETAYAAAVTAGDIAGGLTYGVDYPISQSFAYYRDVTTCTNDTEGRVTVGEIVQDVCRRVGLTDAQIDVADLTESVDGYVVSRVMSGRDAISPLRSYSWFDCVESDGVLKWPTRGKVAVFAFTADDLAAHIAGDARPSSAETDRQQEVELPRRLRVHYAQTEQNYEPGEQGASRLAAGNVEVRDMEIAVAMSDTKGARIADVVLYDLWVSRNRIRAVVDHSWLDLEPADAGTMPIDGRQERVRITNIDHSLPGLLLLALVRDDDGVYESYALGAPAAYAGTGGGSITIIGTAELVLLDLPLLRDSDNDAGYYAAVTAIDSSTFAGAVLYRSPDGGTTYEEVATASEQATIGTLQAALDPGPTTIIDEGNELFVELEAGALESISETSLLAGLNAAAIGADGRWEVIQFRDAVSSGSPTVWRLTGLLRGRRGTEWAVGTSQLGDRFVLLDSALMRVPMNIGAIGAERPHKAVLVGTSIEATTAVDFTGRGVALEPFAPVSVEGEWDGGDLVISWVRRGRIGQELPDGADIPLSEETEAYEVEIVVAGSPDVVRTISATSPTATYTAAQIAADFGSPTPASFDVRIYQLSAVVGRGYAAEATL